MAQNCRSPSPTCPRVHVCCSNWRKTSSSTPVTRPSRDTVTLLPNGDRVRPRRSKSLFVHRLISPLTFAQPDPLISIASLHRRTTTPRLPAANCRSPPAAHHASLRRPCTAPVVAPSVTQSRLPSPPVSPPSSPPPAGSLCARQAVRASPCLSGGPGGRFCALQRARARRAVRPAAYFFPSHRC